MATKPLEGAWTHQLFAGAFDDPVTCCLGYCCPCVVYGQTAEKIHGGDCVSHALKFYLSACCCSCGMFAGPTRRALRDAYKLPAQPGIGTDDAEKIINTDCITYTIPCVACFALCQDANETRDRGVTAPLAPAPDPIAKLQKKNDTTATAAPKQETMEKDAGPTTPAVVEPVPASTPAPAATQ